MAGSEKTSDSGSASGHDSVPSLPDSFKFADKSGDFWTSARAKHPRDLFADHLRSLSGTVGQENVDLSKEAIEKAWDQLGPEGRQPWEAQYGRNMSAAQEAWQQSFPDIGSGGYGEETLGGALRWTIHPTEIGYLFSKFFESYLKSIVARDEPVTQVEYKFEDDIVGPSKQVPSPIASVLHRAELYRITEQYSYQRHRPIAHAKLHKIFQSMEPLTVKLANRDTKETPPFEIINFLAALPPKHKRKSFFPNDRDSSSEDGGQYQTLQVRNPPAGGVRAVSEAGTLLIINSPTILEAIHHVAPSYPQLIYDGSSLVVPEPFCVLFEYRDDMLHYYSEQPSAQSATTSTDVESAADDDDDGAKLEGSHSTGHIQRLYDYIDDRYLSAYNREQERYSRDTPMCTFEWVWLLFKPDTLVYERQKGEDEVQRAYTVKHFELHGLFDYHNETRKPQAKPSRLNSVRSLKYMHNLQKVTLLLDYFTHDGRTWQRRREVISIRPWDGERAITDLPVFPARFFHDPDGSTRTRLISRGRRYHSLASRGQLEYHGQTLSGTRRWIHSRIVVDSETYHHDRDLAAIGPSDRSPIPEAKLATKYLSDNEVPYHRDLEELARRLKQLKRKRMSRRAALGRNRARSVSSSPVGSDANSENFNVDYDEGSNQTLKPKHSVDDEGEKASVSNSKADEASERLAEDIYMTCDRKIVAYVLTERRWVFLDVDHVSDCQFNLNMIDDLQVPTVTKDLLQALAQTYMIPHTTGIKNQDPKFIQRAASFNERWSADFVQNKGKGQVILLHGRPGVGKTTTGECIAELTKRPLLTISCGSLGTESIVVERNLTRWLRIGELWNAVLLFDEADVFLEHREQGDLERNSVVSIFLRALEYYQGLLFLTTNRIGVFDEAIMSRIHVILHYSDLLDQDRERIWDTSFRKLATERPDINVDFSLTDFAYRDKDLRDLRWNGREIRNAFNTMIALAEWDAREHNRYTRDGKIQVRRDHLQQVAKMSRSYRSYMRSLRGIDSAAYAKARQLRDDQFSSERQSDD